MNFKELREKLEKIMSEWDGKDRGTFEERASLADEALATISNLEHLLAELGI